MLGDTRVAGEWLPDNDQIEEELREYLALFQSDTQPDELRRLREIALDWMRRLAEFHPYVTGAVLNGTANAHSDIHLQAFTDNPKDVAIYLLNQNVQYDVSETRHFAGRADVETLSFLWRPRLTSTRSASTSRSMRATTCAARSGPTRAAGSPVRMPPRCARSSKQARPLPNRNDSTMMMKRMLALAVVAAAAVAGSRRRPLVPRPGRRRCRRRGARRTRQPGRTVVGGVADGTDGKPATLSAFKGQKVVVNFWASWCGLRRGDAGLVALSHQYKQKGIRFIGIGVDSEQNVKNFLQKVKVDYPVFVSGYAGADLARNFGIRPARCRLRSSSTKPARSARQNWGKSSRPS